MATERSTEAQGAGLAVRRSTGGARRPGGAAAAGSADAVYLAPGTGIVLGPTLDPGPAPRFFDEQAGLSAG